MRPLLHLKGVKRKKAVIFATCGGSAKDTLPILEKALAAKQVTVAGQVVLTKKEIEEGSKVDGLIEAVKALQC